MTVDKEKWKGIVEIAQELGCLDHVTNYEDGCIILEGWFTADQLRSLADVMDGKDVTAEAFLVKRSAEEVAVKMGAENHALKFALVEKDREIERLQKLALTCCACNVALADLQGLKRHIIVCPDHPIAQYVAAEREACARIVEGSADFDTSDDAAQVAVRCGMTKAIAAAIRARK